MVIIQERDARTVLLISGLLVATAACSFGGASSAPSPSGSGLTAPASPVAPSDQPLATALHECSATSPGGPTPPGGVLPPAPYIGNGRLWVGLWPDGLVVVPPGDVRPDGSLRMKFMWVRGPGIHGILRIS